MFPRTRTLRLRNGGSVCQNGSTRDPLDRYASILPLQVRQADLYLAISTGEHQTALIVHKSMALGEGNKADIVDAFEFPFEAHHESFVLATSAATNPLRCIGNDRFGIVQAAGPLDLVSVVFHTLITRE